MAELSNDLSPLPFLDSLSCACSGKQPQNAVAKARVTKRDFIFCEFTLDVLVLPAIKKAALNVFISGTSQVPIITQLISRQTAYAARSRRRYQYNLSPKHRHRKDMFTASKTIDSINYGSEAYNRLRFLTK